MKAVEVDKQSAATVAKTFLKVANGLGWKLEPELVVPGGGSSGEHPRPSPSAGSTPARSLWRNAEG